ncbi:unnamed protein product [Allacma fusca]|uniref:Uncharacterized protein n=1 Tax=Allacma fusca TaxID=39272 RepID=A0A8J2K3F8_9HEXA|nr:unnamed protein product [Allacma fusca]
MTTINTIFAGWCEIDHVNFHGSNKILPNFVPRNFSSACLAGCDQGTPFIIFQSSSARSTRRKLFTCTHNVLIGLIILCAINLGMAILLLFGNKTPGAVQLWAMYKITRLLLGLLGCLALFFFVHWIFAFIIVPVMYILIRFEFCFIKFALDHKKDLERRQENNQFRPVV